MAAWPQGARFPLESVAIEGSSIPTSAVLEIAELRVASPIDKAGIEGACKRLEESGLFASISYRYAPGPNKGYALTLALADQERLLPASVDVTDADEEEVWGWVKARFPRFDHRVPEPEPAQQYLVRQIQRHLGDRLRGQRLTARIETDLITRKTIISFQPENLPRIRSVAFTGNQAVTAADLGAVLNPIVANFRYTPRSFAAVVEENLRSVYEERGFYRVRFTPSRPEWREDAVALTVDVAEGGVYRLGKVEVVGDDLPVDKMLAAAKLQRGKTANWKQIQNGIWEMEKIVKRTGFFGATAAPERIFDDTPRELDLRIRIAKGPLYRVGEVRFIGLSQDIEREARRLWKPKPGDPYDYAYPNDFFQAFARVIDFNRLRKYDVKAEPGVGDHVMDLRVIFEPR